MTTTNPTPVDTPIETTRPARVKNYLNNKDLLANVVESKRLGRMSNELAVMLQTLTGRYAKKGNFANYCVDEQTEILTTSGWKNYLTLTEDDIVLSYDIDTDRLMWSKVFGIFRNDEYKGPMQCLVGPGVNAFVSPGHKFVSVEQGITPIEQITENHSFVLMGSHVPDASLYNIPDSFVEMVGVYVNAQVPVSPVSSNTDTTMFPASTKVEMTAHTLGVLDFVAPNKVLTADFITSLTHQQRMLLMHTITIPSNTVTGTLLYTSDSVQQIDAVVMLCTLAGLTTHTSPIDDESPATIVEIITQSHEPSFNTIQRRSLVIDRSVDYSGTIWCPQTQYGTFVARRYNSVYITGNSYNEDMQAYAMLMLCKTWHKFDEQYGNPFAFYTQCIKNSFIQYLNQERRVGDFKNKALIENGFNPSYSFILEYEADFHDRREAMLNGTLDEYARVTDFSDNNATAEEEVASTDTEGPAAATDQVESSIATEQEPNIG